MKSGSARGGGGGGGGGGAYIFSEKLNFPVPIPSLLHFRLYEYGKSVIVIHIGCKVLLEEEEEVNNNLSLYHPPPLIRHFPTLKY